MKRIIAVTALVFVVTILVVLPSLFLFSSKAHSAETIKPEWSEGVLQREEVFISFYLKDSPATQCLVSVGYDKEGNWLGAIILMVEEKENEKRWHKIVLKQESLLELVDDVPRTQLVLVVHSVERGNESNNANNVPQNFFQSTCGVSLHSIQNKALSELLIKVLAIGKLI